MKWLIELIKFLDERGEKQKKETLKTDLSEYVIRLSALQYEYDVIYRYRMNVEGYVSGYTVDKLTELSKKIGECKETINQLKLQLGE